MNKGAHIFARITIVVITTILVVQMLTPKREVHAQWAVVDAANVVQSTITAISTAASNISAYYDKYRNSVLVPLMNAFAQAILQELTANVVDWINHGFNGNPAFLTNPGGFFLDAADQATGALIQNNGILARLCSPFNLDLRLALALGPSYERKRYTCTFSSIPKALSQSSVHVGVGVSQNGANLGSIVNGSVVNNPGAISVNGDSMSQFVHGDFSQGGWPGFFALTTETQNNEMSAYLKANSDLKAEIAAKQAQTNSDLNRSNGFLSWQKCTDAITVDPRNHDDDLAAGEQEKRKASDPTVTETINKDGTITYQSCRNQTPGSVISGAITKQLGAPTDSLVAASFANSINAITNALFNYLLRTVLNKGLASADVQYSTNVITTQVNAMDIQPSQRDQVLNGVQKYLTDTQTYKSTRDQAVQALQTVQTSLTALISLCATNKHPMEATAVQNIIDTQLTPALTQYTQKDATAASTLTTLLTIQTQAQNATTNQQLTAAANKYSELLQTNSVVTAIDLQNAQTDLTSAQNTAGNIQSSVSQYQTTCAIPAGLTTYTSH